jgi:hypothetical protein
MADNSNSAWRRAALFLTTGAFLLVMLAAPGEAQAVRVAPQALSPNTAVGSLSISAAPASVQFNLVSRGVATGSSAVAITTSWGGNFCILTCTVTLYAYFATSGAALSGGSPVVNIPSSEVLGQVPTGTPTSFTAFTQSNPVGGAGASLELFSQSFFLYAGSSSRTDDLNLEIDLSSQPQMPAGTYTGTLYIQAQSL